jgi:hypothetical protein
MTDLKLMALDSEDLPSFPPICRTASSRSATSNGAPRAKQFRCAPIVSSGKRPKGKRKTFERRRAVLAFKRVLAVRSSASTARTRRGAVAARHPASSRRATGRTAPSSSTLAGGATIMLDVECIEVQLADIGGAWETASKPRHPDGA